MGRRTAGNAGKTTATTTGATLAKQLANGRQPKAHVVIIRQPDGTYRVRPGTFIVDPQDQNQTETKVRFKNLTGQRAVLVFPAGSGINPEVLTLQDGEKRPVEFAGIASAVYPYQVVVDGVLATGDSDPSIIVD